MTLAKLVLCQRFLQVAAKNNRRVVRLLTVQGIIQPMQCMGLIRSGTVLWSHLLLASREATVTHARMRQGGGVRHVLGVRQ